MSNTSSENLDIARRFIELSRQGDWSRLDLLADDVIYRPIREVPEFGEYRGREGFRHYMEAFFWSEWAQDLVIADASFRECGDAVIVRVELSGEGRASGLDFAARVFEVLTLKDGQIVRIEDFLDRDEALEAAGCR